MAIDNEDHFDDLAAGVEPEEPDYDEDEVLVEEDDTEPYTTKDIAKGVVDLLNSASMDWETGSYDELDDAAEALGSLIDRKGLNISEDEFDRIFGDGDYFILQKYIENHPHDAEMIFNTVAKAFGYSNYKDYITYVNWVEAGGEDEMIMDLNDLIDQNDRDMRDRANEATNAGAIASVPGKHIRIDLDEEDEDDPNN